MAPRTELRKRDNGEDTSLPFTFLTNGGGFIEERKAQELNIKLKMNEEDPIYKLTARNIIQCHTPLREKALVDKYKNKYVLVCGYDEVLDAALKYGYEKAIHVDELAAVYPNAVPMDIPTLKKERIELFRNDLETRF
jgi:ribonucleotide monophosphatase NagD (HAD superfamily)